MKLSVDSNCFLGGSDMKQKKRTKAIAIVLSLAMVFSFVPFLGTQEAYAVQNSGTVTIDLTQGAKTYNGSDAAAIYLVIDGAIRNGGINVHGTAGSGNQRQLFLDVNNDYVDDMKLIAEMNGDAATSLVLEAVDGCSQSGEYGLRLNNTMVHYYLDMPYFNDYELDHFYETVRIQFPEIQHVDIPLGMTKFIYLADGMKACTYDDAEAAAIYTLLMDPYTRLNGNGRQIRHDLVNTQDYLTNYIFFLDEDDIADVYVGFQFDENKVCDRVSFQYLEGYDVYDTILVNLPPDRLNIYGALPVPNEYGLEYMYTNLMFNAQIPFDNKGVELSRTAFTYNGKVQKPAIVKVGESELVEGEDYAAEWSKEDSVNAGTYTVTIKGTGHYRGTTKATYKINKAANTLKAYGKTVKVKKKAVKKKNQTLAVGKVLNITNRGQGKLTYAKLSGNKKITINAANGTVTVKKKLKKGTYTVAVRITAAGNANYNSVARVVKFTVKVK